MIVLYEDNHIIVVVKPAGVTVMPDKSKSTSMLELVKIYVKDKYSKPGNVFIGLVHRLDRPTGGVMVFARTSKGASRISKQIRDKQFHKTYLAVVKGTMNSKSGVMKDYLLKDIENNKSHVVERETNGSKEALLSYTVLDEKAELSLLSITLETGRHHQIRVQLSNSGHPIVGDLKYGGSKNNREIALWANKITFSQPVTGEIITVESKPNYFKEPWSLFS